MAIQVGRQWMQREEKQGTQLPLFDQPSSTWMDFTSLLSVPYNQHGFLCLLPSIYNAFHVLSWLHCTLSNVFLFIFPFLFTSRISLVFSSSCNVCQYWPNQLHSMTILTLCCHKCLSLSYVKTLLYSII
jgi:hypothetical protein